MKNKAAFGLLLLALSSAPIRAAGLKLSIHDGTVTLDAQDVTLRQILTEWARLGKTRIVNLEGVTSGPITLKLDNVPERVALDIILRSMPGYMAAPRAVYTADASIYDRILIMTTTSAVAVAARPQGPGPAFQGTQLRTVPPFPTPGAAPEPMVPLTPAELAADQMDDPAVAAAAAAGLIAVPAPVPGQFGPSPRGLFPGTPQTPFTGQVTSQPPAQTTRTPTPAVTTTTNPFNVPTGTAMPSLPPPPSTVQTPAPLRPPSPDR